MTMGKKYDVLSGHFVRGFEIIILFALLLMYVTQCTMFRLFFTFFDC